MDSQCACRWSLDNHVITRFWKYKQTWVIISWRSEFIWRIQLVLKSTSLQSSNTSEETRTRSCGRLITYTICSSQCLSALIHSHLLCLSNYPDWPNRNKPSPGHLYISAWSNHFNKLNTISVPIPNFPGQSVLWDGRVMNLPLIQSGSQNNQHSWQILLSSTSQMLPS